MRVEGSTALSWRRGRYAHIPALKGPRPLPLQFGEASIALDDLLQGTGVGADFRCRARLHSFDDAYVVMGEGDDGAVVTGGLESVVELCAFTQLGHRPRPADLSQALKDEVLEDVVVGVDGASHNYYHWLVNALGRARLCAEAVGDATILLPDFRLNADEPGRVRASVLQASAERVLEGRSYRLLAPGVYRARRLTALWTQPTAPTDVTGLAPLYDLFEAVSRRVAPPAGRPRRRLYFARRGVHDARLPAADLPGLDRLLARYGFEALALEDMSFEEQVRAAAEAEIIVAPHGAGLTNLVFSRTRAVVIELTGRLNGEASFRPWFFQLCSGRGQRYGAIHVAHPHWLATLAAAIARCAG